MLKLRKVFVVGSVVLGLLGSQAQATTEDSRIDPAQDSDFGSWFKRVEAHDLDAKESRWSDKREVLAAKSSAEPTLKVDPTEAFLRTIAVLDHFGVPSEEDSESFFDDLQDRTPVSALPSVIHYLDLGGNFPQFSTTLQSSDGVSVLKVFRDFKARQQLDYSVRLAAGGLNASPFTATAHSETAFLGRLRKAAEAAKHSPEAPLAGLRIALDPGHMGGNPWDERTGKFVHDQHGNRLSEGLLALQITLLLESRFKSLGAEVMITRRGLSPVISDAYESLDLKPYGLTQLRESTLEPWFQSLLEAGAPGGTLYRAFEGSSDYKKLFSETMRWRYFFLMADLDARVRKIEEFAPDLTLIVHLDAGDQPGDPNGINTRGYNATKAYVPGGFMAKELASRSDRKFFGRYLLDQAAWNASLQLSREVVGQIHSQLGIRLETGSDNNVVNVEPGVLARNLNVQRRLPFSATSYLECLFYNDPSEFTALSRSDYTMSIDGHSYSYSERLNQLARAIGDGVVRFVTGFQH